MLPRFHEQRDRARPLQGFIHLLTRQFGVLAFVAAFFAPMPSWSQLQLGPVPDSLLADSTLVAYITRAEAANPRLAQLRSRVREQSESVFQERISWLSGLRVSTSFRSNREDETLPASNPSNELGLTLSWDLESLVGFRSRTRAALEKQLQAELDLVDARRELRAQVVALYHQLKVTEHLVEFRTQSLESSRSTLVQVRQQFLAGRAEADALFDALDSERKARESLMEAELKLRLARIQWETLIHRDTSPSRDLRSGKRKRG